MPDYINKIRVAGTEYDIKDATGANISYYVCSTAAANVTKVISDSGSVVYTNGTGIRVKFTNGNTNTAPSLQTGSGTSAKTYSVKWPSSRETPLGWENNSVIDFVFDSTVPCWRVVSQAFSTIGDFKINQDAGNNITKIQKESPKYAYTGTTAQQSYLCYINAPADDVFTSTSRDPSTIDFLSSGPVNSSGTYNPVTRIRYDGKFETSKLNATGGTISGITFSGNNSNTGTITNTGTISGGTINGATISGGSLSNVGGTFAGTCTGTFAGTISGTLTNVTLAGTTTLSGTLNGGTIAGSTIGSATSGSTVTRSSFIGDLGDYVELNGRLRSDSLGSTGAVYLDGRSLSSLASYTPSWYKKDGTTALTIEAISAAVGDRFFVTKYGTAIAYKAVLQDVEIYGGTIKGASLPDLNISSLSNVTITGGNIYGVDISSNGSTRTTFRGDILGGSTLNGEIDIDAATLDWSGSVLKTGNINGSKTVYIDGRADSSLSSVTPTWYKKAGSTTITISNVRASFGQKTFITNYGTVVAYQTILQAPEIYGGTINGATLTNVTLSGATYNNITIDKGNINGVTISSSGATRSTFRGDIQTGSTINGNIDVDAATLDCAGSTIKSGTISSSTLSSCTISGGKMTNLSIISAGSSFHYVVIDANGNLKVKAG